MFTVTHRRRVCPFILPHSTAVGVALRSVVICCVLPPGGDGPLIPPQAMWCGGSLHLSLSPRLLPGAEWGDVHIGFHTCDGFRACSCRGERGHTCYLLLQTEGGHSQAPEPLGGGAWGLEYLHTPSAVNGCGLGSVRERCLSRRW